MPHKDYNKMLILGLDGATFDLVDRWSKEGRLPHIRSLIERGYFGLLKSVPNLNSAAAWSSLVTGLNPGKHGIFFFHEHIRQSFKLRFLNATHRQGRQIWDILSENGKRVGVINVPMTYPAKKVNGFMIPGLDTPSPQSEGFTYPAHLYKELIGHIGSYTIESDMGRKIKKGLLKAGIDSGLETIKQRTKATTYLLLNRPWDFFMVVFRVLDNVQHHFWRYLDTEYPLFDPNGAKKYKNAILRTYEEIDHAIGKILDIIPDNTNILIVSDHGSAPAEFGPCYLNHFLEKTGYLYFNPNNKGLMSIIKHKGKDSVKRFIDFVDTNTWGGLRSFMKKFFFKILGNMAAERYYPAIDWRKSLAYSPLARPEVWINLKEREPFGIVSEEDYNRVCEELIRRLEQWYDPKTKRKVIKTAKKRINIYKGPYVDKSADIIIQFNDHFVTGIGLPSHYIMRDVRGKFDPVKDYKGFIFGKHADNGIIIASGPDFNKAEADKESFITDIMPTVLYLMGIELPACLDGRVLEHIIKKVFLDKNQAKVSLDERDILPQTTQSDYSGSDSDIIKERLRNLGYVE